MAQKVPETANLPKPGVLREPRSITRYFGVLVRQLVQILQAIAYRVNLAVVADGSEAFTGPVGLNSYTVAGVPDASDYTGGVIYVSNETGGAVPAFSDGTNWRRVTDRAIIS